MMTFEALAGKTIEAAASSIIEKASPKIIDRIATRLSREKMRVQIQFTKTFQDHLVKTFERSERIKTVISRDKPVLLEEIYVDITLTCGQDQGMPDKCADPTQQAGSRFVISGTGGAGKTVLMKHLLNSSKQNRMGFIPIFIELRNLQFDKGPNLESCIFDDISKYSNEESYDLFKVGLEEGIFALYLDGFDEIHPEEELRAIKYISEFLVRYPQASILITTRPQTGAITLRSFTVFHVEPLNKNAAISLIERTDFDDVTKGKFLKELKNGLYEKHQTLMSLPILVAMMLLAYRTYADIPDRMTVFYGQAFETLYSIHDSENKELYKRTHHAGLAPDVFKTVLQAFCYLSLSSHDIEFSELTLNSYIKRALSISDVTTSAEKYKNDLIHNVCILQPDGLSYAFVHRSFQEYFAALFAINYSGSRKYEAFDRISQASGSAVPKMLMEIDQIKTKRYWLIPKMKHMLSEFEQKRSLPIYRKFALIYGAIYLEADQGMFPFVTFEDSLDGLINFHFISILGEIVDDEVGFSSIAVDLDEISLDDVYKYCTYGNLNAALKTNKYCILKIVKEVDDGTEIMEFSMDKNSTPILNKLDFRGRFSNYKYKLARHLEILEKSLSLHNEVEDSELFS